MAELRVLSTMGLAGVLRAFGPEFEAARGARLAATFLPTMQLLERIRAGERGDVAILTGEGIDALRDEGVLEGRTDLARSFVGIAVRAGAPHPDISSTQAFVAALLHARSVAMSKAGASGIFMAGLLERLGIAQAVREKATILASGFTAELAAAGQVEIAIQQVSELMVVPGGGDRWAAAGGARRRDRVRRRVVPGRVRARAGSRVDRRAGRAGAGRPLPQQRPRARWNGRANPGIVRPRRSERTHGRERSRDRGRRRSGAFVAMVAA
jgi:molybdate transport system substrate-binding protein